MLLSELLTADRVRIPLGGRTKDDLLRELVEIATAGADPDVVSAVLAAVREREFKMTTGIGDGVAVPHGRSPRLERLTMAAGAVADPVDFESLDGAPVKLFFLLVGPESAAGEHVQALSRVARLLRGGPLRGELCAAQTADEFLRVIRASEAA